MKQYTKQMFVFKDILAKNKVDFQDRKAISNTGLLFLRGIVQQIQLRSYNSK